MKPAAFLIAALVSLPAAVAGLNETNSTTLTTIDIAMSNFVPRRQVNCALLLQSRGVDCRGLAPAICDVMSWAHTGCKRQPQCASKTGIEAKNCCDDFDRVPFGGGVSYDGYLRACAPQHRPRFIDRPALFDQPCDEDLASGSGINIGLYKFKEWQKAGCKRKEWCEDQGRGQDAGLEACCDEYQEKPDQDQRMKRFANLYHIAFQFKCRGL